MALSSGTISKNDPLSSECSNSTATRKYRHGLWAMYQALHGSKIFFLPDDNELDRIWDEVPESIKVSLHGVKVWGSIDCTLMDIPQQMLARVHNKAHFYACKNSPCTNKMVYSGNALANLFVCDIAGRLRFVDVGRPGSCHDTRQLRESTFPDALKQFPTELRKDTALPTPKYKIVADDGFKGVGNGVDPHLQLRKGYPTELTEAQQCRFSHAVEFIRSTVEHVNGDFKALMATDRSPPVIRPSKQYCAENDVAVLTYAFFRYEQPIALDRFDGFE